MAPTNFFNLHTLTGMRSLWMSIKHNYPVLSRMAHFYCSRPPLPPPWENFG